MSDFDLPTKLQLTNCCDQIQAVVDALPTHTDATLTNRWRLLPPIKSLFTSLQRLEDDETRPDGAFNTADAFAKRNLGRIITSCSVVANQIQIPNSSRHNDSFGIELMTLLKNQIEDFLTLRNTRPNPGTSPCSSAPTEDHLTKQQEHESEDEAFSIYDLYPTLTFKLICNQGINVALSTDARALLRKRSSAGTS